jgi:hypothetical protein
VYPRWIKVSDLFEGLEMDAATWTFNHLLLTIELAKEDISDECCFSKIGQRRSVSSERYLVSI